MFDWLFFWVSARFLLNLICKYLCFFWGFTGNVWGGTNARIISLWNSLQWPIRNINLVDWKEKNVYIYIYIEAQDTFFVIQVILFFFFFFLLFSRREKKRKDYYRYLRQWIIEIFIITQPYKLCTKRETKVEIALPRKITWLPSVNLCCIRSCLTDKMNTEYNIL